MDHLKNEFEPLADRLSGIITCRDFGRGDSCFSIQLKEISRGIRLAWEAAAFSYPDKLILTKYFSYQLDSARELLAKIEGLNKGVIEVKAELSALLSYLYNCFGTYLANDKLIDYSLLQLPLLKKNAKKLAGYLGNPHLCGDIGVFLVSSVSWLFEISDSRIISIGSLKYVENLIYHLLPVVSSCGGDDKHQKLEDLLIMLDFNHHGFFRILVNGIRQRTMGHDLNDQLNCLRREFAGLPVLPEALSASRFNDGWPSVITMLRAWLSEEIAEVQKDIEACGLTPALLPRLPYQLSVAQHACLTRLFYDAGIYNTTVAEVIAFSAAHSSSKRQVVISEGSYAKEYYSTTQKTAAVVLDLLQKTTVNLKRNFFP